MNKQTVKITALVFVAAATVLLPFARVFAQTATPSPRASVGAQETVGTRARALATRIFDEHFLNKLNALRARVSGNTNLTEEQRQLFLAKIDTEITWFSTKKGELLTATTLAQIRTIVRDARTRFVQMSKELRLLYMAKGFVTSLERVITNLEKNIVPKVEAKLTDLQGKGVEVTTELGLLLKAKTALNNAKTEISQVKTSTTYDEAKKNFDEAKKFVKEARQELKDLLISLRTKV